jgi:hypothetical protein
LIILRYQKETSSTKATSDKTSDSLYLTSFLYFKQIFNLYNQKEPTDLSTSIAKYGVLFFGKLPFVTSLNIFVV